MMVVDDNYKLPSSSANISLGTSMNFAYWIMHYDTSASRGYVSFIPFSMPNPYKKGIFIIFIIFSILVFTAIIIIILIKPFNYMQKRFVYMPVWINNI